LELFSIIYGFSKKLVMVFLEDKEEWIPVVRKYIVHSLPDTKPRDLLRGEERIDGRRRKSAQ